MHTRKPKPAGGCRGGRVQREGESVTEGGDEVGGVEGERGRRRRTMEGGESGRAGVESG